jgi:hypothetical protein
MPPKRIISAPSSYPVLNTYDEIISFILENAKRGGADIDTFSSAISDYEEKKTMRDLQVYLRNKLHEVFGETSVAPLLPLVTIESFSLETGDDWRYDRSKMSLEFNIVWKPDFVFKFSHSMDYSDTDGINYNLECEIKGKSKSLADWSGNLKHEALNDPAFEWAELQQFVKQELGETMVQDFAEKLCWLVTVIIAEANFQNDCVFRTSSVDWSKQIER